MSLFPQNRTNLKINYLHLSYYILKRPICDVCDISSPGIALSRLNLTCKNLTSEYSGVALFFKFYLFIYAEVSSLCVFFPSLSPGTTHTHRLADIYLLK